MVGMDGSEKTKPFVTPLPYLRERGMGEKGKGAGQKGVRDVWAINRGGMSETTGRRTRVMTISPWHWSLWQPAYQVLNLSTGHLHLPIIVEKHHGSILVAGTGPKQAWK